MALSPIRTLKATKLALLQSKFHRSTRHQVTEALKPFKLGSVDWIVLGFLEHKKKPVAISEVAANLGIPSSFMAALVGKLAKRDLVSVASDKKDRRRKYIAITGEGRAIVKRMQAQFIESFAPLVEGLSARDLATYEKVVTTIIRNIEKGSKGR